MGRNNFNFRNKALINIRFLYRNKLCSCHYRKQQECQTRHNNFVNDNSAIVRAKCSRKDKHDIVQVKYVEANGEIEFSRKFWKLGKNLFSRSTIMVYNNDQQTVMRIIV